MDATPADTYSFERMHLKNKKTSETKHVESGSLVLNTTRNRWMSAATGGVHSAIDATAGHVAAVCTSVSFVCSFVYLSVCFFFSFTVFFFSVVNSLFSFLSLYQPSCLISHSTSISNTSSPSQSFHLVNLTKKLSLTNRQGGPESLIMTKLGSQK